MLVRMNRDEPGRSVDPLPSQRKEAVAEDARSARGGGGEQRFLSVLAHDLRNRVAPMRNAVHLIRLHATTDPVLQSIVEILERQINGMVRLLEAIVDADRINRGELVLTRSEVDLAALIASAVQLEQPLLDGRKQQVSVTLP